MEIVYSFYIFFTFELREPEIKARAFSGLTKSKKKLSITPFEIIAVAILIKSYFAQKHNSGKKKFSYDNNLQVLH